MEQKDLKIFYTFYTYLQFSKDDLKKNEKTPTTMKKSATKMLENQQNTKMVTKSRKSRKCILI